MKIIFAIAFINVISLVGGCSDAAIKRTGYETLQNIREQECYKTPSVECEGRESMEVYEDRRKDAKHSD